MEYKYIGKSGTRRIRGVKHVLTTGGTYSFDENPGALFREVAPATDEKKTSAPKPDAEKKAVKKAVKKAARRAPENSEKGESK